MKTFLKENSDEISFKLWLPEKTKQNMKTDLETEEYHLIWFVAKTKELLNRDMESSVG